MEEGLRAGGVNMVGVSSDFVVDNSNQLEGGIMSNVDTRTTGADQQHDCMHQQTELADVLIPMLSVLEIHGRFENTLYEYFLGKKVAFMVMERYILNVWQKYGVKTVMGDNSFVFIQFSYATGLEGVLEHGSWLIRRMDYARALVDIRVNRALKDTMVISVLNPCPKRVITDLRNLRKQGGMSNDSFQPVQRKSVRDPFVSKHGTGANHSLPMQQVPKSAYPKKTASTLMSNAFSTLEEYNGKPMNALVYGTRNKESDDVDVENRYDEMVVSSKSF
nr:hypothetical protein [Tanacetum cinerariifolium]